MKLYYFDIAGRAEAIRLVLHYYKAKFEDIRYSFEDWKNLKVNSEPNCIFPKLEFGQMPALELENGKVIVQSQSILFYLGSIYNCLPKCENGIYSVKYIMDLFEDFIYFFQRNISTISPFTPEAKKENMKKFENETLIDFLKSMEKKLKENCRADFIVGNGYSIGDFSLLANYLNFQRKEIKETFMNQLKNYPLLDNYFRLRLRDFKDYLKCHYPKIKLVYFPLEGRGEPIRLLLRHAKVDFKDVKITQEEFYGNYIKESIAKQLPELKMGCKKFNQTPAIMKMLGTKYGYLPFPISKDAPMKRVLIEKVMGSINDLWSNIGDYKFVLPTPEAKQKSKDTFVKEKMPTYFGVYEEMLNKNSSKEFIVGDSYTVADFYMLGFARGNIFKPFAEVPEITSVLAKYPLLKSYFEIRNKDFP